MLGNAASVFPELAGAGEHFDLVTDQTAAHDPLTGYVPAEVPFEEAAGAARARSGGVPAPRARVDRRARPGDDRVRPRRVSRVRLREQPPRARPSDAGLADAFSYPGFVPAYIRPLFCRGIGPFRWAVLSGDPADIDAIDRELASLFPDDALLQRWLELAPERVAFQGLPARICWLGYGDRAKAGLAINELVRSGAVSAPVVIGRDHLDAGSVASPYRETEAMRDGSDAIADWPILNALVNVAAGATWVSVHHGGGVGIGNSIHAGMVVVADGTRRGGGAARARAHDRSGHGRRAARGRGLRRGARGGSRARESTCRPSAPTTVTSRLLVRDLAQLATPAGRAAPLRGDGAARRSR